MLATEHLERHRQVLLVVDEAQMLTPAQLQVLRLLTSAELDSRSYLTLLLVGQPMLAHRLRMGDFASYVAPGIMSRDPPETLMRTVRAQ